MIIRSRRYDIARQDPVLRHRSQRDSWNSCNSILFRDSILELWQKQALHYIVMANCKAAPAPSYTLNAANVLETGVDPYSRNFPKVKREYDYRGRAIPSFEDTIRSDSSFGAWTHVRHRRERTYSISRIYYGWIVPRFSSYTLHLFVRCSWFMKRLFIPLNDQPLVEYK